MVYFLADVLIPEPVARVLEPVGRVLFDVSLRLLNQVVNPGGQVTGIVNLFNLGSKGPVNVTIFYTILDGAGVVVYSQSENATVDGQQELAKTILLANLPNGQYKFMVGLAYPGQTQPAQALVTFFIIEQVLQAFKPPTFWYVFTLIILLVAITSFLRAQSEN